MSCVGCEAKEREIERLVAQNQGLLDRVLEAPKGAAPPPSSTAPVAGVDDEPEIRADNTGQVWVMVHGQWVKHEDYRVLMDHAVVGMTGSGDLVTAEELMEIGEQVDRHLNGGS